MKLNIDIKIDYDRLNKIKVHYRLSRLSEEGVIYHYVNPEFPNDLKEGYIGVTLNLSRRKSEHKGRLHNLPENSEEIEPIIIGTGTLLECLQLENYLRPVANMGWNIAIGGGYYPNDRNSINKARISRYNKMKSLGRYVGDHLNTKEATRKSIETQILNAKKLNKSRASHLWSKEIRNKALNSKIKSHASKGLDPFSMIHSNESRKNNGIIRKRNAELKGIKCSSWLQNKEIRDKANISKSKTIYKYDLKFNLVTTYLNEKTFSEINGCNASVARSNQDPFYLYTKDNTKDLSTILKSKFTKTSFVEQDSSLNLISIINRNTKINGLNMRDYMKQSSNKFISSLEYMEIIKRSETKLDSMESREDSSESVTESSLNLG